MILPLSDAPNPRGRPVVTSTLIALNVAIYLFLTWPLSQQAADVRDPLLREYVGVVREVAPPDVTAAELVRGISAYDLFVFRYGFRPSAPQWLNLLTSIFLHGGFLHLFGNMLFLWIYGDNVEHRLGRVRYLFWYLFTGVAATLFYALFAWGSKLPLVGASGAISGVLGFYFLWFPRNTVRLFVFLFPIFMNVVEVPARWVLGFYLVIDNLLPFLFAGEQGGGGVAHGAHLGGFVAGLAIAWFGNRREVAATPRDYRQPVGTPAPSAAVSLGQSLAQGDFSTAARRYFTLSSELSRRVLSPGDSLALARWLGAHGQVEAALTVYRRHLRDYPAGPGRDEAHLGAGLIQLEALRQIAPAYQHFLEALESNPSPAVARQAREALAAIERLQRYHVGRRTEPADE